MSFRDIVVIGGSSGALDALRELVGALPERLNAAVMIVVHSGSWPSALAEILRARTKLPVTRAVDGEAFVRSHIYVPVPDRHLIIEGGRLRLSRGPRESYARPAVDALFRSAAYYHGPRVIGVVLSGGLDDGTAGLWAIKDHGGIAIVQSPGEALSPSMPRSAIQNVEVDHEVRVGEMGELLRRLVGTEVTVGGHRPVEDGRYAIETRIALADYALESGVQTLGPPTFYTCPDCNGSLLRIEEGPIKRYRCHTGHAFSERSLNERGVGAIEKSIWSTIAHLEEQEVLMHEMEQTARAAGASDQAAEYRKRATDVRLAIRTIREVALGPVFSGGANKTPT